MKDLIMLIEFIDDVAVTNGYVRDEHFLSNFCQEHPNGARYRKQEDRRITIDCFVNTEKFGYIRDGSWSDPYYNKKHLELIDIADPESLNEIREVFEREPEGPRDSTGLPSRSRVPG